MLFLDQLIEHDGKKLLKWKHLCNECQTSTKGKIPRWFKLIEELVTEEGSRFIKREYYIENRYIWNKNVKYDETIDGNKKMKLLHGMTKMIRFFVSTKRKQIIGKKFKIMGIHMIVKNFDEKNNFPELINCKGCSKNIRLTCSKDQCFIYINNEVSRKVTTRKENEYVKPYETLENLIFKNNLLKDDVGDNEIDIIINDRIEAIDQFIDADKEVLNIIKNIIMIEEGMVDNNMSKW